jgi:ribosomal protein L22
VGDLQHPLCLSKVVEQVVSSLSAHAPLKGIDPSQIIVKSIFLLAGGNAKFNDNANAFKLQSANLI